jgi:putative ABC transport system ATP-binding protein
LARFRTTEGKGVCTAVTLEGTEFLGTALRLRDVTFAFPRQEVPALHQVSLTVRAGERVALTGPSGCGKSTLVLVAAGIVVPDSGSVEVNGAATSVLGAAGRAAVRRKSIGIVFQFGELVAELTLVDNVALADELAGASVRSARQRARALLTEFGLGAVVNRLPGQVSGGQAQRSAVARAFVHQPAVVLADEPTGALDRANSARVLDHIEWAAERLNAGVLLATHDPVLASWCDRTVEMLDGRIRE